MSVEAAVKMRPRDALQRDDEGGRPQGQALLGRDAPDVLEGGRHGFVQAKVDVRFGPPVSMRGREGGERV